MCITTEEWRSGIHLRNMFSNANSPKKSTRDNATTERQRWQLHEWRRRRRWEEIAMKNMLNCGGWRISTTQAPTRNAYACARRCIARCHRSRLKVYYLNFIYVCTMYKYYTSCVPRYEHDRLTCGMCFCFSFIRSHSSPSSRLIRQEDEVGNDI